MISQAVLTDTWQQLPGTLGSLLIQTTDVAQVFINATAPGATDPGITIRSCDVPLEIVTASRYGTGVWVRGQGRVRYAIGT